MLDTHSAHGSICLVFRKSLNDELHQSNGILLSYVCYTGKRPPACSTGTLHVRTRGVRSTRTPRLLRECGGIMKRRERGLLK